MTAVTVGMATISAANPALADTPRILGPAVNVVYEPVNLSAMSVAGYDDAHQRLAEAATRLVDRGATSVMIEGTSFTFYRGHAFHDQLLAQLRAMTGKPVSTASKSLLDGLAVLGARKLAVATAYTDEVNDRLHSFLTEAGYDVLRLSGLGIAGISQAHAVTAETVSELAQAVFASAPTADCLVISCGGLRTLDLVTPLESQLRVPVVTSYTATIWGLAWLAGSQPVRGFGQLLDVKLADRAG
jgi:arylmalonate decarboxylase